MYIQELFLSIVFHAFLAKQLPLKSRHWTRSSFGLTQYMIFTSHNQILYLSLIFEKINMKRYLNILDLPFLKRSTTFGGGRRGWWGMEGRYL